MLSVGMATPVVMPIGSSLPYSIFKTVKLPYAAQATTAVFQDKSGIIWIGTYHGVGRYDGYKIAMYMTEQTMTPKQCSVMSIAQIDDRRLIVGSLGGLSYLNMVTGKSEPVAKPLDKIKSVRTMLIHGDDLWIGTDAEGVWKYNLKSREMQQIACPGIRLTSIYALCPVGKTMYVGSLEGQRISKRKE